MTEEVASSFSVLTAVKKLGGSMSGLTAAAGESSSGKSKASPRRRAKNPHHHHRGRILLCKEGLQFPVPSKICRICKHARQATFRNV